MSDEKKRYAIVEEAAVIEEGDGRHDFVERGRFDTFSEAIIFCGEQAAAGLEHYWSITLVDDEMGDEVFNFEQIVHAWDAGDGE